MYLFLWKQLLQNTVETSDIENAWSWYFQNEVYHFYIFKIDEYIAKFELSIYLINQNWLNIKYFR